MFVCLFVYKHPHRRWQITSERSQRLGSDFTAQLNDRARLSFITEETKCSTTKYIFQESQIGVKLFIFMTNTLIKIRKSIIRDTHGDKDLATNAQIH